MLNEVVLVLTYVDILEYLKNENPINWLSIMISIALFINRCDLYRHTEKKRKRQKRNKLNGFDQIFVPSSTSSLFVVRFLIGDRSIYAYSICITGVAVCCICRKCDKMCVCVLWLFVFKLFVASFPCRWWRM